MKTIRTALQAEHAKKGLYRVDVRGVVGLYFRKTSDQRGAGAFYVRYDDPLTRKDRYHGLGPLSAVGLAGACERAQEIRTGLNNGVDPIEERSKQRAEALAERAKQKPVSFAQAAEAHLEAMADGWRHRRAREVWFGPIRRYAFPIIGETPVSDIRVEHIAAILRAATKAGRFETALRIRSRIAAVLDGCIALGQLDPRYRNPADAKLVGAISPMKRKAGERPHFRRLAIADAPRTFQKLMALAEAGDKAPLDAFLIMALCAVRPSEALGARWDEIDLSGRLWTIPAARTKSLRAHIAPLPRLAIQILERRRPRAAGDLVFPGRGGGRLGYTTFRTAPRRAGIDVGTLHGWRSVFADWAGNSGISLDLIEAQLAHKLKPTPGAYRRETAAQLRGMMMEKYCDWLSGADAKVLAFPASRA
jgi:integrase